MTETRLPSRYDRIGMYIYAGFGAVASGAVVWQVVSRLLEVAPGRDVPVLVPFDAETATLPIGPDGQQFSVGVEQATVIVPEPAAATMWALWAEPIVLGVCTITGIVLAAVFCLRLARGKAFQPGTANLVFLGVGVLAVGWFLGSLLTGMTVNGALSAVSDFAYDGIRFTTDFAPMFGILLLTAVAMAFQIGERLQRETEGLV